MNSIFAKTSNVLILIILFFCVSAFAENRVALVIGNSDYVINPVSGPEDDARTMAETLKKYGFDVYLRFNADQIVLEKVIRDFSAALKKNDVGFFYYAGNGLRLNQRNYLLPIDAEIESSGDIELRALDAAFVVRKMAKANNPLNFVILDTSRFNSSSHRYKPMVSGLAELENVNRRLLVYAFDSGAVSSKYNIEKMSFVEYLSQHVNLKGVTDDQFLKHIREAVSEQTLEKDSGEVLLAFADQFKYRSPISQQRIAASGNERAQNKSRSLSQELELWDKIKDSRESEVFEAYLKFYPDGKHATAAKVKLIQYYASKAKDAKRESDQKQPLKLAVLPWYPATSGWSHLIVEKFMAEVEVSSNYVLTESFQPWSGDYKAQLRGELLLGSTLKYIWKGETPGARVEPDFDVILEIGHQIDADRIILGQYKLSEQGVSTYLDSLTLFLVDVHSGQVRTFSNSSRTDLYMGQYYEIESIVKKALMPPS